MRVSQQKLIEYCTSLLGIVQIVFIDFADGEQRIAAVLAAGILLAQEPVLRDGLVQDLVVIEAPPHLDQRLGNRHHTGIGLGRSRGAVIDVPVGVDNALVVAARALGRRTTVQGFPHPVGCGESIPSPGFTVMRAGISRHSR